MMKKVMVRAWEIAREGQSNFGGKVSEYLAEALKIAWAEISKSVKTVTWKNDRGITIEMAVEHITERVIGYDEFFGKELIKKVDEMKITKLVIDGTEINTWNTSRTADHKAITTGLVNFRGQDATITVTLPAEINEKVWGEYDKRQDKKKAIIDKINKEEAHMNKVYNILECGA